MLACEHRHRYEFAAAAVRRGAGARPVLRQRLRQRDPGRARARGGRGRQRRGHDRDGAGHVGREHAERRASSSRTRSRSSAATSPSASTSSSASRASSTCRSSERALELLREHAEQGVRVVASVPNSKMFEEHNPFHVTDFGYDEALAAFAGLPGRGDAAPVPGRGLADLPAGRDRDRGDGRAGRARRAGVRQPLHLLRRLRSGAASTRVHHGRMQLSTAPLFNRWSEGLKHGAGGAAPGERAPGARAGWARPGSAAASALARLADREAQMAALQERCRMAEARVAELERSSPRQRKRARSGARARVGCRVGHVAEARSWCWPPAGRVRRAGRRGGSEQLGERRRRAAEVLIPWIEQTVPLAGQDRARVRLRQRRGQLRVRRAGRAGDRSGHRRRAGSSWAARSLTSAA